MKELLYWDRRDLIFIDVQKTELKLDKENNVTGYVFIESFDVKLSRTDQAFLESLGFRRGAESDFVLPLKVTGKRYAPHDDLGPFLPTLDRTYVIHIHYPTGFFSSIAKAALTPITVAADATILIGKILLVPFRGQ